MSKILVTSASQAVLKNISALLKKFVTGCSVITLKSGQSCIKKAEKELPDVILLDSQMPGMNGYDVCMKLKADDKTSHIPVVMLIESQRDTESSKKVIKAGADAVLAMPVNEDVFVMQVNAMLRLKKAEDALRSNERDLEENEALRIKEFALSSSINGIGITDLEGNLTYVNDSLLDMWKYSEKEVLGKHITEFFKEPEMTVDAMKALKMKGRFIGEFTGKRNDGSLFTIILSANLVKDQSGNPVCMMGSILDLTERKQIEEALKESSLRLQLALRSSDVGLWDWNTKTNQAYFSPEWKSQIGFEPNDFQDTYEEWESRLHPEDRSRVITALGDYLEGRSPEYSVEFRFKHRDGTYRWILAKGELLQDESGESYHMLGCHIDITERKWVENLARIQRDLGVSLEKTINFHEVLRLCLRAALKASDMDCGGIYIVDPATGTLDLPYHEGLPEDFVKAASHYEADSNNVQIVMAGNPLYSSHKTLVRPTRKALSEEGLKALAVVPFKHANRVIGCLNVSSHTYEEVPQFARNTLETIASQIGDAIANKQAGKALRESEERLQAIIDNNMAVIYLKDTQGKYLLINSQYETLFHVTREQVIGKTDYDIFPEEISDALRENDRRVLKEGKSIEFEEIVPHDDGIHTYISIKFPISDISGITYGVCGISTDITERKQAEAQIFTEKKFTDTALDAQLDTFFLFEPATGKALRWNRAFKDISGYSDEEIAALPAPESYYSPEDLQRAAVCIQDVLKEGTGTIELELICKNGSKVPTEYLVSTMMDEKGELRYFISIGRNITHRKQAEEALLKERDRIQKYLDIAGVMLIALDSQGCITLLNKKGCEILECSEEETLGKNWFETFLPGNIQDEVKGVFTQLMSGDIDPVEYFENSIVTARGNVREMAWHNNILNDARGNMIGALSSGEDITERKLAEEALRESEQKFRIAVGQVPGTVWTTDTELIFTMSLGAGLPALGLKPDQVVGMDLFEFFNTDDPDYYSIVMHRRALQGESVIYNDEFEDKYYQTFLEPLRSSEGEVNGVIGISFDVTDTKQAEKALIESEKKYRSLFDNIQDGFALHEIVLDENNNPVDYIFLDINDAFERVTGLKKRDLIGEKVTETLPGIEKDPAEWIGTYGKVALTGESISFENFSESLQRWYSVSAYRPAEGQFAALLTDITETKKSEEKIKTSLKEKEVLLSEIHHRVKNNLQIISSLLNLQSRHLRDEHDKDLFKDTQNRVFTMAMIHEKLYESNKLASVDFNEYINDLTDNLLHSYNVNATSVKSKIEVGDVHLSIDLAIPCAQIINELISNSFKHAFPEGGKGEVQIKFNRTKDGKYKLIISDNGIGFPEGVDFRKTESLGLKVVNSLTQQLHGNIELDGRNGTKFTLTF